MFETSHIDGAPLDTGSLPIVIALTERVPAHRRIRFRTLDQAWRQIEITAVPIEGQGNRHLGAMAMFWELPD